MSEMSSLSASFLVVFVLLNQIQTVHLRKQISRFCGPTITEDVLMFHGNDQVVLQNQQYNAENFSLVQFAFKTTAADGLLLLITDSEATIAAQALEFANGKLVFRLSLGTNSTVMISNERYNDGKWHDVETKRIFEQFDLMIDGAVVSTTLVPQNFYKLHNDSIIYFGNSKKTHHLQGMTMKGFRGFLRNIHLGNTTVDLDSLPTKSSCQKRRSRRETPGGDCSAGVGLKATYIGSTNIELSWNSTNCCVEYEICSEEFDTESTNETTLRCNTTMDRHIEIKDLKPEVYYKFTLRKSEVPLAFYETALGNTSSLIVDEVTETSIAVHLELLNNDVSEYELTISDPAKTIKCNISESCTINNLDPGKEYEVKVSAVNVAENINRTIRTRGNFLKDFKCNPGQNEGEIGCSWAYGSGNDCGVTYQLYFLDPSNTSTSHELNSSNYVANTFRMTHKRIPGQKYSISIQSFSANYNSTIVSASTIAKTGILESFFSEAVHVYSNHSITLNYFSDSDREIEYYNISLANQFYNLSPSNSTLSFENLEAGHRYEMTAVAMSNGVASKRLPVSVNTVPNPPSDVSCIGKSNTSLTVKVDPPERGTFDNCEIIVDGKVEDKIHEYRTIINGTFISNLTGVKPFTNYTIKVKYIMTFMGLHSEPQTVICQTAEGIPDEVLNIKNHTFESDHFIISWEPPASPNGNIIDYIVKAENKRHNLMFGPFATKDKTMRIEVDKSYNGYTYNIVVKARTSAGEGKENSIKRTLKKIEPLNTLLVVSVLILSLLLVVLIGLLGYYFIRKSPSRMQSVRRLSSRLLHSNNEMRHFKQPAVSSKPVKISDFLTYMEKLEKDSGLKITEEYEDLKFVGRNQSRDEAELQCNRPKNRFTNILPYDISRIKLLAMEDEEGSDYINASWIPGFHSKREFIASQGPLPSTVNDFWRMIWENNCQAIVMLTLCIEKGHIKCEQYWPVQSEPVCYGDVKVEIQNEIKNEEWITREFNISMGSQSHKLIHFHYVTWPDMYVPQRMSLITFVREVRATLNKNNGKGPIVVHCSAGVGRSGTFIALDTLLHQILANHDLDVYGVVFQMRMSRVLMVQTEAQYTFIYECLKQLLEERNGPSETKTTTEVDAKTEDLKEKEAESIPNSDSKEKQSETKKEATESNLDSNSKEKEQAEERERVTDKAKDMDNSDKDMKSSPKENSTKNESNLNVDESSSKTVSETNNLEVEVKNQTLSDDKDVIR